MTNIKPKSCTSTSVFLLGKLYQSPVSFYYLMVAVSAATLTQRLWREQPLYVCVPWRRCDVGAGVCQAVCIVAYGAPVTSSRPVYLKRGCILSLCSAAGLSTFCFEPRASAFCRDCIASVLSIAQCITILRMMT